MLNYSTFFVQCSADPRVPTTRVKKPKLSFFYFNEPIYKTLECLNPGTVSFILGDRVQSYWNVIHSADEGLMLEWSGLRTFLRWVMYLIEFLLIILIQWNSLPENHVKAVMKYPWPGPCHISQH